MKKIYIKAYTEVNLGDDLFIRVLCERYPNVQFYMTCPKSSRVAYDSIKNLTLIPKIRYVDSIFRVARFPLSFNDLIAKSRIGDPGATVHIGGSIFMQSPHWQEKVNNHKKNIKQSKNYFIIGSNFGPYEDQQFLEEYNEIFSKVNDVCFRDQFSYEKFEDLNNVRVAPDVIFSLDTKKITKENKKNKTIVISIIDLSWRKDLKIYQNDYERKLAKVTQELIQENYDVILMSFCEKEGDEKVAKRIEKLVSEDNVSTYFYRGDMDAALKLIKSSEGIIATRFHAMILGWIFNKPTFPFVYSEKMTNVINDIDYNGDFASIGDSREVDPQVIIDQLFNEEIVNVEKEIKSSHLQFKATDRFLSNNEKDKDKD